MARRKRCTSLASTDAFNAIDEQAARWAIRSAYGEMTEDARAEMDAWLAADPRHRGAYWRARAGLRLMEDAVDAGQGARHGDNDNPTVRARSFLAKWNRRALAGIAAGAAGVALLFAMGVPMAPEMPQHTSAAAERVGNNVTLSDGSVVTLAQGAEITVSITGDSRRITLLSGEALFHVAKDPRRPFVVRSGNVYAQATGTVYSVRRVGRAGGRVDVREGHVLVWADEDRSQAVLLHAGGSLTLDPGPVRPSPRPSLPPPAVAQISLDDVPIAEAARRFNSVNARHILIDAPEIGEKRIVGLFRANDPDAFARAAALIAGARVEHRGDDIVIVSK